MRRLSTQESLDLLILGGLAGILASSLGDSTRLLALIGAGADIAAGPGRWGGDGVWPQVGWLWSFVLSKVYLWFSWSGIKALQGALAAFWVGLAWRHTRREQPSASVLAFVFFGTWIFWALRSGALAGFQLTPVLFWALAWSLDRHLRSRSRQSLAVVLTIQVIWTNLDPWFFVGPLLAVGANLREWIAASSTASSTDPSWDRRQVARLMGGLCAASLVNPWHVQYWRAAWQALGAQGNGDLILWTLARPELDPSYWSPFGAEIFLVLLSVLVYLGLIERLAQVINPFIPSTGMVNGRLLLNIFCVIVVFYAWQSRAVETLPEQVRRGQPAIDFLRSHLHGETVVTDPVTGSLLRFNRVGAQSTLDGLLGARASGDTLRLWDHVFRETGRAFQAAATNAKVEVIWLSGTYWSERLLVHLGRLEDWRLARVFEDSVVFVHRNRAAGWDIGNSWAWRPPPESNSLAWTRLAVLLGRQDLVQSQNLVESQNLNPELKCLTAYAAVAAAGQASPAVPLDVRRISEVDRSCWAALEDQFEPIRVRIALGLLYLNTNRLIPAASQFSRVLRQDPRSAQAALLLGRTLVKMANPENLSQIDRAFNRAAEIMISDPTPFEELGRIYAAIGDANTAGRYFRLALDRDPQSPARQWLNPPQ